MWLIGIGLLALFVFVLTVLLACMVISGRISQGEEDEFGTRRS